MSTILAKALALGAAAALATLAAAVGFFEPSEVTPATPWFILGLVGAVWLGALVVGTTVSSSGGWTIGGAGLVIAGIAIATNALVQNSLIFALVGLGLLIFSVPFTLAGRSPSR